MRRRNPLTAPISAASRMKTTPPSAVILNALLFEAYSEWLLVLNTKRVAQCEQKIDAGSSI